MVINENKTNGDEVTFSEYNQLAATVNDLTDNGLPHKLFFSGTDHEGIVVISLTTAQRDALTTPDTGAVIWNSTTTQLEVYNGTSWSSVNDNTASVDFDLNNNDLLNIKLAEFANEHDNGNSTTSFTLDWNEGNHQKLTLTGNAALTFTAPSGVGTLTLKLVQDTTGSRVPTYPASVKWKGGTAPTLSTAANAIDIVTFYYDGTTYYGVANTDFQ